MNINRRSLFQMLAAAPAVGVATTAQSAKPEPTGVIHQSNIGQITIAWSGWQRSPSANSMTGWFTAILPVMGCHQDDVGRYSHRPDLPTWTPHYDRYVSMVLNLKAYESRRVFGVRSGEGFNIDSGIYLDEHPKVMIAMNQGPFYFEDLCNHYFAKERDRAYVALRKHLEELTIV